MIKIGKNDHYPTTVKSVVSWNIFGKVIFTGKIKFFHSSNVFVSEGALLSFGTDGAFCGSDFKCCCYNRIVLGNTQVTWECSLND